MEVRPGGPQGDGALASRWCSYLEPLSVGGQPGGQDPRGLSSLPLQEPPGILPPRPTSWMFRDGLPPSRSRSFAGCPRRTLDGYPGAWDRPRGLLSLRPHPTMPLRLRRPLGRSGTVGSERFVRVVRQGVPNRAQRKDLHRAQEIPRDDETRWRPAHCSLSSRRRPSADHPDEPPIECDQEMSK